MLKAIGTPQSLDLTQSVHFVKDRNNGGAKRLRENFAAGFQIDGQI